MLVNTRRLFTALLTRLRITVVCDVGAMDGADALRFRQALPLADIYAFEANPENFRRMAHDPRLRDGEIQLLPLAVADRDGTADFYLVAADYSLRSDVRGMSSLYPRTGAFAPASVARVETARLDTLLTARCRPDARLALWIDAEGKSLEVIAGVREMASRLHLLHVEVETIRCIGSEQALYPDVRALLERLGFDELATDYPHTHLQFNALYVRRDLPIGARLAIRAYLLAAVVRHKAVGVLSQCCPGCLRALVALRSRIWPAG